MLDIRNGIHANSRTSPSFLYMGNLDIEPELESMVGQDNRPLYLPGNSMATEPHDRLRGRPIMFSPHAPALGDPGDLLAVDWAGYCHVINQNSREEFSIHVKFLEDKGVYRLVMFHGGQPYWEEGVTEPNSTTVRSFASAIAQRA